MNTQYKQWKGQAPETGNKFDLLEEQKEDERPKGQIKKEGWRHRVGEAMSMAPLHTGGG